MKAVAVVGAGPAGFYTVDSLSKADPTLRVDLIERLPFPFGLVRYGVAVDHQGTKQVAQVFARTMRRPNVSFFGGVELGRTVSIAELEARYSAVVLATGAAVGRKVAIPGAELPSSVAGCDLTAWFNGHPDRAAWAPPRRIRSVCVIGNGNVSLDVARLLAKSAEELAPTDANPAALIWLAENEIAEIHLCGRQGPGHARFTAAMLAEFTSLARFRPVVDRAAVQAPPGPNLAALAVLQRIAGAEPDARLPIHFHFGLLPVSYDGNILTLREAGTAAERRLPADLLVHAVGQYAAPVPDLPYDESCASIRHTDDQVPGSGKAYVAGWAGRPGEGVIASHRERAQNLAQRILATLREAPELPEDAGIAALLAGRGIRAISWVDWTLLDNAEIDRGRGKGRVREKFTSWPAAEAALRELRSAD
ncbi:FAD-dependent oxidoreductase [Roseomonas chloroacetimidivorans]|uniref:FAD-dependent oxidoreductase n=1 Tax=Roseomonas chloroacetimidivorans TaxID=1766656 RepID=UPI003C78EFDA